MASGILIRYSGPICIGYPKKTIPESLNELIRKTIGMANIKTQTAEGIIRINRLLILGQAIMIAMLTTAITVTNGFSSMILCGILISASIPDLMVVSTPSATWNCWPKIITPIAASIPSTTDAGNISPSFPILNKPKSICSTPATIVAANT